MIAKKFIIVDAKTGRSWAENRRRIWWTYIPGQISNTCRIYVRTMSAKHLTMTYISLPSSWDIGGHISDICYICPPYFKVPMDGQLQYRVSHNPCMIRFSPFYEAIGHLGILRFLILFFTQKNSIWTEKENSSNTQWILGF